MLEKIPNSQRCVPVPRRIIRYLAGGCSRVLIGTMVGHLLSCVYYRAGLCCPDGHCKATWIAKVFGLSLRRVKHVRHELEALGILQRHDAPQWVLNHYGVDLTINTAVGRSTTRRRAEHDTILTDVSRSCCIVSRKRPKR